MATPLSSNASRIPPITDEKCQFTVRNGTCGTLRPCHDCLKTTGCRVSEFGRCERDTGADARYDYKHAIEYDLTLPAAHDRGAYALKDPQHWRFPASDHLQYCPSDDTTCIRCNALRFFRSIDHPPDSRFCLGKNGCLCIDNCLRSDAESTCTQAAEPNLIPLYDVDETTNTEVIMGIIGAVTVLVILAITIIPQWRKRKYRRRDKSAADRRDPSEPASRTSPVATVMDIYSFFDGHSSPTGRDAR